MNLEKFLIKSNAMDDILNRFGKMGLFIPEILLPRDSIDREKWAIIACDQFTQDRGYWEKIKNTVNGTPSMVNLIYPEVYLSDEDRSRRIDNIHLTMNKYLSDNIFSPARTGCIYTERNTPYNSGRRGLVIAVDLEHYDWKKNARDTIRCTEGTVPERLPPRMEIRRNAALETTHVLLLIDDDQDKILPMIAERAKRRDPAYQSSLMQDSGDIKGWFLDSADDWAFIADSLEELAHRAITRYGSAADDKISHHVKLNTDIKKQAAPFLFAVGDGNHSLATAKEIWEEYKRKYNSAHPCRYALVELENIYDPAVKFEPIHRIVFGLDHKQALILLSQLPGFSSRLVPNRKELANMVKEKSSSNRIGLITRNEKDSTLCYTLIETNVLGLITATLQPLLDKWQQTQAGASIDYIHGENELLRLTETQTATRSIPVTGLLLPPVNKSGFFETIARSGPLPRKSFSMGEACEKRFYLECRKLFG